MYGMQQNNDPLSDPKIAALLASVASYTETTDDVKTKKENLKHPAETIEDFLRDEKINEWPQKLTSEGILNLSELDDDPWTKEGILKTLTDEVPLCMYFLTDMQLEVDEYSKKLDAFTGYIVSNEELPSRFKKNLFHAPEDEFLEKIASSDAVIMHSSSRKTITDTKQTMAEEMQALRSKNIDYGSFPGFRDDELTELPSQLEAPQLLNKVSEAQTFNKGFTKFWKKIFLSEASASLLQDTFWWFFLENFENNTTDQDKLYTRISSSYVSLFMSINPDIRDKVFQVYPRCISQCVYLTFREAFPESPDRLAEQFLTDVYNTISEWMSGVRPPVDEWKKWPWDRLCPPPSQVRSPTLPRKDSIKSQGRKAADFIRDLQIDSLAIAQPPTADSSITSHGMPEITLSVPTEEEKKTPLPNLETSPRQDKESRPNTKMLPESTPGSPPGKEKLQTSLAEVESAQTGPGPDFERVMFNLGGRSPLVAHYLYMKQLRNKKLVGKLMRRTEIMQYPPPAPTFQQVIQNSKKVVNNLHKQRSRMMAITEEERKRQDKLRKVIAKETRRLQDELLDPGEIKMHCDRVLDQALGSGLHRPSSYPTVRSTPGDPEHLLQESPDCLPDPNSVI